MNLRESRDNILLPQGFRWDSSPPGGVAYTYRYMIHGGRIPGAAERIAVAVGLRTTGDTRHLGPDHPHLKLPRDPDAASVLCAKPGGGRGTGGGDAGRTT
jgi:hypothetical protein